MGQNSRANKSNSEGNKSQSQLTKIEGKSITNKDSTRGKRKTIGLMEVLWNTPTTKSSLFLPKPFSLFFSLLLSFNYVYLSIFCLIYQSAHQLLHHISGSQLPPKTYLYYYLYFFMVIYIQGLHIFLGEWSCDFNQTLT